jgi:FtsP/CotA-like multicopper oxidase with cupredoxin domain
MKIVRLILVVAALCFIAQTAASAQREALEICPRPAAGSTVSEPEDLRSENGVLRVDFTYRSSVDANGQLRYCYLYKDGSQSPNLRLHPGDWLVLMLKNELKMTADSPHRDRDKAMAMSDSCGGGTMNAWSTNLHFHGLSVPPVVRIPLPDSRGRASRIVLVPSARSWIQ